MKLRFAIALLLSAAMGGIAGLLNMGILHVTWLPDVIVILIPLVDLGLAPLAGLAVVRPNGIATAIGICAALEVAVVIGATFVVSATSEPSFVNGLPMVAFYGFCEFAVIAVPIIAIFRRVFLAQRES